MENNASEPTAETVTEPHTNAVVTRPKAQLATVDTGVLPILPRNIEEAARYASGMIAANIVPDAFRVDGKKANPVDQQLVLFGILKSLELGVAPQTGLAGLLPLNGRFSVWGDLAASLVQRHGLVKDQEVEWTGALLNEDLPLGEWPDNLTCVVRYWRVGQDKPYEGKFSVRDAKRANLWMNQYKKPWLQFPKRMLFNRARAFALRDGFSDGLQGLSIAEEVIDHIEPVAAEAKASENTAALLADETETNGAENGKAV
jgi:hypothetical protein